MTMVIESHAFSNKLVIAEPGCIKVGYSVVFHNEPRLDDNNCIKINSSFAKTWLELFRNFVEAVSSGEATSNETDQIVDHFEPSLEYKCEKNFIEQQLIISIKRSDIAHHKRKRNKIADASSIVFSYNEVLQLLSALSYLLIFTFGLPPIKIACFSELINILSEDRFMVPLKEKSIDKDQYTKLKQNAADTLGTESELLSICSAIITDLNLDLDVCSCYVTVSMYKNLVSMLIDIRLLRNMCKA